MRRPSSGAIAGRKTAVFDALCRHLLPRAGRRDGDARELTRLRASWTKPTGFGELAKGPFNHPRWGPHAFAPCESRLPAIVRLDADHFARCHLLGPGPANENAASSGAISQMQHQRLPMN